jgi:predicted membrane protein
MNPFSVMNKTLFIIIVILITGSAVTWNIIKNEFLLIILKALNIYYLVMKLIIQIKANIINNYNLNTNLNNTDINANANTNTNTNTASYINNNTNITSIASNDIISNNNVLNTNNNTITITTIDNENKILVPTERIKKRIKINSDNTIIIFNNKGKAQIYLKERSYILNIQ